MTCEVYHHPRTSFCFEFPGAVCYNNPQSLIYIDEENLMGTFLSVVGLILLLVVVWAIAKFVLKLAGRAIGCVLTAILAIGILVILWIFVF